MDCGVPTATARTPATGAWRSVGVGLARQRSSPWGFSPSGVKDEAADEAAVVAHLTGQAVSAPRRERAVDVQSHGRGAAGGQWARLARVDDEPPTAAHDELVAPVGVAAAAGSWTALQAGAQGPQATRDALAHDGLRRPQPRGELGVVELVDDSRLDRPALVIG